MKITYCLSVANEEPEFRKLYETLRINKRDEDNILVLVDLNKCPISSNFFDFLEDLSKSKSIRMMTGYFGGNFSHWKNHLIDFNVEDDFKIFLDADELLPPQLIDDLPIILELNPDVNIFGLARQNFTKGITQEYADKWGWTIDELGRNCWPDVQFRICRSNLGIRWSGKVHETLVGPGIKTTLPLEPNYSILHSKTIQKQIIQNSNYETGDYSK